MLKMLSVLSLVLMLVIGCATEQPMTRSQKPDIKTYPNQPYPKKEITLNPVQLGEQPPELIVGTRYILRQGNVITKQWTTMAWLVKDKFQWQGKNAYLIDISGGQNLSYIIWDRDLNILATTDGNGKVVTAFEPCVKLFTFPLKVGTTSTITYDYWIGGKKMTGITEQIKVDGKESVSVPAGTYETIIVKRSNSQLTELHYYAPMVGFPVKWRWTQGFDHPNGPGEFAIELVKIEKDK
jgi:hypothetical protein